MTIRINEPALDSTEQLLFQVLKPILDSEQRVLFLCPAGQGEAVLQRLRVMISRKRKAMERRGKKSKRFRFHSSIHSETHDGKRYDACVCWRVVTDSHIMAEALEDILSNG